MNGLTLKDALKLSVSERIQFVWDLWDSIALVPDSVKITDAQMAELDRRLESVQQNTSSASPWQDVLARIKS
jgi:putative addiction module component (TIGR02574 family)